MEIARKVSGATLAHKINLKGLNEEKYLGRIYGVVSDIETVTTQYGEASKFVGEFVAVRADGEGATAPSCYMPDIVASLTEKAFKDSDGGVKFGFDFYAVPSDKSKTGYIWKAQPLMEVKPSESLLSFAGSFPAIPSASNASEAPNADASVVEDMSAIEKLAENISKAEQASPANQKRRK